MAIFLKGLGLTRYRGIGEDTQLLGPFKDFNFFIGANNTGKSIVLNFIYKHLNSITASAASSQKPSSIDPLEIYSGGIHGGVVAAIGIPVNEFLNRIVRKEPGNTTIDRALDLADKLIARLSKGNFVWLQANMPFSGQLDYLQDASNPAISSVLSQSEWRDLWTILTAQSGGSLEQNWLPEILKLFKTRQRLDFPKTALIPAIRQIGPRGEDFLDFSGKGLIDRLAQIQSPDHDKREDRKLFESINRFLKTVTGHSTAEIEVPHNREHILVHMDNRVLPLASLGTGIQEVILIAASCTLSRDQIVCIEEPELHLHPLLQRKLIAYLKNYTNNQYFIATHSASFIDTPGAAIFHVTNNGAQTLIRESILQGERYDICIELGHKASDIVQSNAVIWVEGPSDRIYLKSWIEAVDPNLIEGIHYSIMFYGGRLLSHLSANDDEVTDFISLRGLNRNLAIVMDSDKKSADDDINETKMRIAAEIGRGRGVAWITAGREIENYINHRQLQAAVQSINQKSYIKPAAGGQFDHALFFRRTPKKKYGASRPGTTELEECIDKVKVARIVTRAGADLSALDLEERVTAIVAMIRKAND